MELIQGLNIDIAGSEMKTIFGDRLKYHQNKIVKLEQQITTFKKIDQDLAEESERINRGSNTFSGTSLEDTLRKHKAYEIYFRFMVEHVVVDATYRLSQNELQTLGIKTDDRYY